MKRRLALAMVTAIILLLVQGSISTQYISLWPVYLPVVLRADTTDARYVAWMVTPQLLPLTAHGIYRWGRCEDCQRQYVPFGYDCQVIARWASEHLGRFFVLGDEPDQVGISPEDYLAWYMPCYRTIKAADGSATVALTGIAQDFGQPGMHGLEYLNALWALGFQTDQLRVHSFPPQNGASLERWKNYIEGWLVWRDAHLPGVPLALGAFGYPSGRDADPLLLARMEEMLDWLEASPLEEWYWWQWHGVESPYNANRLWDGQALTPAGLVWQEMAGH